MATFTEVLPNRTAINWTPSISPSHGLLTIHDAKKSTDYAVAPLHTSWGRGFTLTKLDGSERYCVLIGKPGEFDRCDCPAGCYRPNALHGCRHAQACRALIANETLWAMPAEVPAANADAHPWAADSAPAMTPDEALAALTQLLFGKPAAKPTPKRMPSDPFLRALCSPPWRPPSPPACHATLPTRTHSDPLPHGAPSHEPH
jgi:hypothetical protein